MTWACKSPARTCLHSPFARPRTAAHVRWRTGLPTQHCPTHTCSTAPHCTRSLAQRSTHPGQRGLVHVLRPVPRGALAQQLVGAAVLRRAWFCTAPLTWGAHHEARGTRMHTQVQGGAAAGQGCAARGSTRGAHQGCQVASEAPGEGHRATRRNERLHHVALLEGAARAHGGSAGFGVLQVQCELGSTNSKAQGYLCGEGLAGVVRPHTLAQGLPRPQAAERQQAGRYVEGRDDARPQVDLQGAGGVRGACARPWRTRTTGGAGRTL